MRTTDHKLTGRVHMVFNIVIKQFSVLFILILYPWDEDVDHITLDFGQHFSFRIKIIMLCGDNYRINSHRPVIIIVLKSHLAFCIRAQVRHFGVLFPADSRQFNQEVMCQV